MEIIKEQRAIEVFVNETGTIVIKSDDWENNTQLICVDVLHVEKLVDALREAAADIEQSDAIAALNDE